MNTDIVSGNTKVSLAENVLHVIEAFMLTIFFASSFVAAVVISNLLYIANYETIKQEVLNTGFVDEATFTLFTLPSSVVRALNVSAVLDAENKVLKQKLEDTQKELIRAQQANMVLHSKLDIANQRAENALVPESSASEFAVNHIIAPAEKGLSAASTFIKTQASAAKAYVKQVLQ